MKNLSGKSRGVVCALVAACCLLFSCSGKKSGAAELTVWCWDPQFNIYAMNTAAEIYQRDNPDVKINVVETPWEDLQQKMITSFTANDTKSLPDIILCQDSAMQKNITNYPKSFYALDGKVDLSDFAQFKVAYGEYEGKHYCVPFDNGATATFLRSDIVEQAGLKVSDFNDITWRRFLELGKIVKEKTGTALISYVGTQPDCIFLMLQSAGKWVFDDNGNPALTDNAALKEAVSVYAEMIKEGVCVTVPDWNAYVATITNGTVASTINGCWIAGTICTQPAQEGKWAVVNTPRLDNVPGATNYSNQGGSSWMILSSSKNADIAADFLNKTFAGSVELYEKILPASGAISTWLPASKSAVYDEPHPFFGGQKIYKDIVEYAGKIPQVKYGVYNYEARDAVGVVMADILSGKKTIDEGLADAEQQVKFIMGL